MEKKMVEESGEGNQESLGKIVVPHNSMWRKAIKNLVERGDLDVESANKCLMKIDKKK